MARGGNSTTYIVDPTKEKKKAPLYYDVDAEEASGNFRVTVLFLIVAAAFLYIDQNQVPAANDEIIDLAGATLVHMNLDHCELLYVQEPPRDQNVKYFDYRVSAEQYLLVQVLKDEMVNVVLELDDKDDDGQDDSFTVRVDNQIQPSYARYEGYFCVIEYHYPKGEILPATIITLTGRHISTITAGRCEVCYLSTRTEVPKGCLQPLSFAADAEDGTCGDAPIWGPNPLTIETEAGHQTPSVIGMRNAEFTDVNITVLGQGYVQLTDVVVKGTADIACPQGSVNVELTHPARAEPTNDDGRVCITDVSYQPRITVKKSEDTVNNTDVNGTDVGTGGGGGGGGAAADPLAVLLAMLLGGATRGDTTQNDDVTVEEEFDESEVEDLGRRLQDMLDVAHEQGPMAEARYWDALQAIEQQSLQLEPPERLRLLQDAAVVNASNTTFWNGTNLTDTGVRLGTPTYSLRVVPHLRTLPWTCTEELSVPRVWCYAGMGPIRVAARKGECGRRGFDTRTGDTGVQRLRRPPDILS